MAPSTEPSAKTGHKSGAGLIILGVVTLALVFALVGHQAWEDYWITYRSSRNLAEGHGLVFQIGERVHTFTSPLGVLVPALGYKLTGSDAGALWFLRLLSIAALAGAASLILRRLQTGWFVATATVTLALLDSKTLQFASSGMETGLVVFFTALVWQELQAAGSARRWPLALGFAGLMWTRPDGFIPALAMMAGFGLFLVPAQSPEERRRWLRRIMGAALLGGVAYAPWFFWAWSYYGSPVPNTIIAKSTILSAGFSASHLLLAPFNSLVGPTVLDGIFAPTFFRPESWPPGLILTWRLLARLAAFAWLLPGVPRAARAASLATLLGGVFLQQIPIFSWYFGPWTLLGGLALGGVASTALATSRRLLPSLRILIAVIALAGLGVTLATMQTARIQDRWIEENGRRAIGTWLRENAKPTDRVFLEPLGYIGYYSGLKMLDFPGLCAPEVTRLIKAGQRGYGPLITTLQPDWLVLRPIEIQNHRLRENGTLQHYQYIRTWNQWPQLDAVEFLPGRSSLEFDAVFVLFKRLPPVPAGPPGTSP